MHKKMPPITRMRGIFVSEILVPYGRSTLFTT